MMRYGNFRLVLLCVAALAFEVAAAEAFSWKGARPELLLVFACFAALFARDSRQGLLMSWTAGLLKDLGSAGPLGLHALLFLAVGAAILRARQVFYPERALTPPAVAFLAACGIDAATALFFSATAGGIPLGAIAGRTLLSAALTAAVVPPLLFVLFRVRFLTR